LVFAATKAHRAATQALIGGEIEPMAVNNVSGGNSAVETARPDTVRRRLAISRTRIQFKKEINRRDTI
jgi:hypothetical protein